MHPFEKPCVSLRVFNLHTTKDKLIMKHSILALACAILSWSLVAQESLSSFDRVIVTGSVMLTLKKGDKAQYIVTGETDNLKVNVDGGKLKISRINIKDGWKSRAQVTVWYTDIRSLYASAGAQISHEGTLNAGNFELSVDTGANGELTIDAQSLDVKVGEGGIIRLDGSVRALEALATTGGILKARDLTAHRVYISCNTGANASVRATEEIDATASLGASISYSGDPSTVRVKETLGGSVRG
jgi:hypothetical protein